MEISQLNLSESQVQDEQNATSSIYTLYLQQNQCFLDQTIEALLSQNIPPFIIGSEEQIKRQINDSIGQNKNIKDKILNYCRKDKSLAELSRRFVNKFQGTGKNQIVLDQITTELKVQRRRIYDIINIMESLGVVSKLKKNLYQWNGLQQAVQTIKIYQEGREPPRNQRIRKQKSLQSLASQFLRLFINYQNILTLDEAADMILKNSTDSDSRKTKIRRLYDIVNVFKCIHLIEKVSNTGQKSGFRWNGSEKLLHFIEERDLNPLFFEDLSDESDQKSNKTKKMHRIYSSQEKLQSPLNEDALSTKIKQEIQIIDLKRNQEVQSYEQMSFFQNMVRNMNADRNNGQDIYQKFTELMWPK